MGRVRLDIMPKARFKPSRHSGLYWLWVTAFVLVADRLTKQLALNLLSLNGDSVPVMPHFSLTLAFNRGAAFSMLGKASGWQVGFLSLTACVVSLVIAFLLYRLPASRRGVCIALALILGGALGNLWDRLFYASVIDFVDIFAGDWHWPVFNVADSAICAGAFWLIIDGFRQRKSH